MRRRYLVIPIAALMSFSLWAEEQKSEPQKFTVTLKVESMTLQEMADLEKYIREKLGKPVTVTFGVCETPVETPQRWWYQLNNSTVPCGVDYTYLLGVSQ